MPAAFRLRASASIKASNTIQGAEAASARLQTVEGRVSQSGVERTLKSRLPTPSFIKKKTTFSGKGEQVNSVCFQSSGAAEY